MSNPTTIQHENNGSFTLVNAVSARVSKFDLAEITGSSDYQKFTIDEVDSGVSVSIDDDNTLNIIGLDNKFSGEKKIKLTFYDNNDVRVGLDLTVNFDLPSQEAGWHDGSHYTLQVDENDRTIVEPGQIHRKVYVSGSDNALSISEIALIEGISESSVTARWLRDHPEYGSTEDLALGAEAGNLLWRELYKHNTGPTSNWLLLERGYDYGEAMTSLVPRHATGESALHPLLITSYGEGDLPKISNIQRLYQNDERKFVVIQDIDTEKTILSLQTSNLILENVHTKRSITFQDGDYLTVRDSSITDTVRPSSVTDDVWRDIPNRVQGLYVHDADDVLIEDSLFDHIGWADDYREDRSVEGGQPPSIFSQAVYIHQTNDGVTFRDNITMRAASFGAQVRSGGFIEDNVFLDNNAALNVLGGVNNNSGPVGNFSLVMGNVVTSAGYRTTEGGHAGALSLGIHNAGRDSTYVGNIVAHLADPNNPVEQLDKYINHLGFSNVNGGTTYYNDTIVYNWNSQRDIERGINRDIRVDNLEAEDLINATIQKYASIVTGIENATISDFAEYVRQHAKTNGDIENITEDLLDFFRQSFQADAGEREQPEEVWFTPDERGAGVRWDNSLNWSTGDVAGTYDGDTVYLNGNTVHYSGTHYLSDLYLGSHGTLHVGQGYLEVDGTIYTGDRGYNVDVSAAGQLWLDGKLEGGLLEVDVNGGRFANNGVVESDLDFEVDGGELIFANGGARFHVIDGSKVDIVGDEALVGFDGQGGGEALFSIEGGGTLSYTIKDRGVSEVSEFISGHYGVNPPDVESIFRIEEGAQLELNMEHLSDGFGEMAVHLADVDRLIGSFSNIRVVRGEGQSSVDLTVDYNYENDELWALISESEADIGIIDAEYTGTYVDEDRLDNDEGEPVIPVNTAPIAPHIQITANMGEIVSGEVIADDLEGGELVFEALGDDSLSNGEFILSSDGTFTYESSINFQGVDIVEYRVIDEGGLSDIATITFNVEFENVVSDGDDYILGDNEDNLYHAAAGNDTIFGGEGMDTLKGGRGRDELYGEEGADSLLGGNGSDLLIGAGGDDILHGGRNGLDTLLGGEGADLLLGGGRRDRLNGGDGADTLDGQFGWDTLIGGSGEDLFVFTQNTGVDVVRDYEDGVDKIEINHSSFNDFDDLNIVQRGSNVEIIYGGNVVRLWGLDLEELDAGDFVF